MKYRSLDEVYLTGTRKAKPTPPGPKKYQPVTESYRKVVENYMLQITDMDGKPVYSSEIPDDKLEVIQRDLDRSQKITVGDEEYTAYEIIDKALELSGWKEGNSFYEETIKDPVTKAFNQVSINRDAFSNLLAIQKDADNPLRTMLLANPLTVYNYTDLISDQATSLFPTIEDRNFVLDEVWRIKPQVTGMAVGMGEIVMTLFSDASKGEKGDLDIPGIGEVEVKGCGAHMGGDHRYAKTAGELNEILKSREITVNQWQLDFAKQNVLQHIRAAVESSSSPEDLKTDMQSIHDLTDKVERGSDLDDIEVAVMKAHEGALPKYRKEDILKNLKNYRDQLEVGIPATREYRTAVLTFFRSEFNLTPEELAKGLVAARSIENVDVSSLEQGVLQLVIEIGPENLLDNAVRGVNTTVLARVIAAIHMACYQDKEKFEYIILANDGTKDMTAIDFPSAGNLGQTAIDTYRKLSSLPGFDVDLGVDGVIKSVGITLDKPCAKKS